MLADVRSQKAVLRKHIAGLLRALSRDEVVAQSEALAQHVVALDVFRHARSVSVYLAMEAEAKTSTLVDALFAAGKRVYVPKVIGAKSEDMVMLRVDSATEMATFPKSKWGIPEPPSSLPSGRPRIDALDALDVDIVLVPGVAFDPRCNRLGHGKGYYDCFLERYASRNGGKLPVTIGIALEAQIVDAVPTSGHDKMLDMVATPQGILRSSASS
ncbi:5-formyltetrahydrofolate cyclo-ligase [Saprolegnia parasitica CBS 223.65]|uniref:5-formyltetrahydrofolate cyclo-ligase n=1 Tax=Saprolegnia parasitica (strain CBS 223.65) TaxID=695850 RepID=A0A067D9P6_SAPPC|nr:5-formyltetrahydrofolate cyclo-ligase [Saprolegnia parasitica CBS 223.65]KDO35707.1 5-formyltetrahydrofolate cyclo-ligase [Saprolegnia parasitica CBS 223.65]|eukprot:XP_012194074.1 5-formyltetrahydrofolate cyclo-ligase [Saprolegnia parasitica CBS 223.65]